MNNQRALPQSVEPKYLHSEAEFSADRVYRYWLRRVWRHDAPTIAFCMLNPSTADARNNDPTIERCERRARAWGYGTLIVVNLFAFRATDPAVMRKAVDPAGGAVNFNAIVRAVNESDMFVCAWGGDGAILNMGPIILGRMCQFYPGRAHALKINVDGSPAHPLYLPYSLTPQPIRCPIGDSIDPTRH